MPFEDEEIDELGEYRDGIVSALEKSQKSLQEYNSYLEERGVPGEKVPLADEGLVLRIEQAKLDDVQTFKQASTYAKETIRLHRDAPSRGKLSQPHDTAERHLESTLKHLGSYFTTVGDAFANSDRMPRELDSD